MSNCPNWPNAHPERFQRPHNSFPHFEIPALRGPLHLQSDRDAVVGDLPRNAEKQTGNDQHHCEELPDDDLLRNWNSVKKSDRHEARSYCHTAEKGDLFGEHVSRVGLIV